MLLPPPPRHLPEPYDWFLQTARRLLFQAELIAAGQPCLLLELEFYWHAPDHPDPFCHRHPLQLQHARWYFHRLGAAYRGGSFKGLDVTFSDGRHYGGILLRGLQLPDGTCVSGPSRLVDTILQLTHCRSVAALDARLHSYTAEQPGAPLFLRATSDPIRSAELYATPRVGLTLRRDRASPAGLRFFARPYRFLTAPRALAAGRPQLVLALHLQGVSPTGIHACTGSPLPAIRRYIDAFEAGRKSHPATALHPFLGRAARGESLCFLYGLLQQMQDWPDLELARCLDHPGPSVPAGNCQPARPKRSRRPDVPFRPDQ